MAGFKIEGIGPTVDFGDEIELPDHSRGGRPLVKGKIYGYRPSAIAPNECLEVTIVTDDGRRVTATVRRRY